ncbi:MAG: hypothetical protein KKG09_04720 [Verrucomicrobia bacterium]|nr:hypothetical protein [Verrucomicrobiota bacterium]MCG2681531.1 hypothetical protein [Kiritimatiellia bacterium]MBU4248187.1 hypothetical protein [Verrucomicrobiota bacterium]MBU4290121.1 hypothetical protein [Verrucomicrobiota bacterium]MBU4429937.1 hypothetical protein [Verrucomicrobiota bacterium]
MADNRDLARKLAALEKQIGFQVKELRALYRVRRLVLPPSQSPRFGGRRKVVAKDRDFAE